ncbi:MAG: GIY-YIG nuclease family protein [Lachnospiraceae bacterium]|nr:GIY-YIG nuclease family protein [Lachnospiraceae bacterium]
MAEKQNVTYILRCSDQTLYTGWTNNIEKRLKAHNKGKGGKYTRTRIPVKLVYLEAHETKQEAMSREAQIKRLTRTQKEVLIASVDNSALCK